MRVAADKFNAQPMKADWLQYCLETGLIAYATASTSIYQQRNPSTTTAAISQSMHKSDSGINNLLNMLDAKNVARFLRNTPGLGKSQIGEFISKGPADLYPFHASVLREYVDTFEFSGIPISATIYPLMVLSSDDGLQGSMPHSTRLYDCFWVIFVCLVKLSALTALWKHLQGNYSVI